MKKLVLAAVTAAASIGAAMAEDWVSTGTVRWVATDGSDENGDGSEGNPYDIVTATIDGTVRKPTAWQDAADLYREWARRQSWCAMKPLRDREDLPKWMRDAPAMVRFGRDWLGEPEKIRCWMRDYWQKLYPKSPLVTAFWGWERHGYWVSDYFPVYPSDEAFAALVIVPASESAPSPVTRIVPSASITGSDSEKVV